MKSFNIRHEVEALLGAALTVEQAIAYATLRDIGYANPYDIVRKLEA